MVVFRVTNRHQVVKRKSHLVERGPQARSLVHSRWQHHHRTLVEYHLVVQPQPPNHLQNYVLRRRPARHNRTPHIEFHPRGAQRGQKLLSRRLGEQFLFTARRIVKQRPILRHDAVKKLRPREHPLQILQPPSCHHQQPSPGCLQVLQRPHCHSIHHAIRGQRPVIVRGQPQVPHQPSPLFLQLQPTRASSPPPCRIPCTRTHFQCSRPTADICVIGQAKPKDYVFSAPPGCHDRRSAQRLELGPFSRRNSNRCHRQRRHPA